MMKKNCLATMALLSAAVLAGCSGNGKNGNGAARVMVSPAGQSTVGVTLTQQYTAQVSGVDNHAVTWSLTGTACSGSGNPCGTISATGLYTAPATPPSPPTVNITATSVANDGEFDTAQAKIVPITVIVSPGVDQFPVVVGVTQQFTATAVPDAAPQTFTWSLSQNGSSCSPGCGTIDGSGLYTAPGVVTSSAVTVTATSPAPTTPPTTGSVNINVVASRLAGSSTYAFRMSGFDGSGNFVGLAGNFITNANGTAITSGVEDELSSTQAAHRAITGGALVTDVNDHATLTLTTAAGTRTFKVALSQNGDGQMIEFDSHSRGSGVFALSSSAKFNNAALKSGSTFVFGMTGSDTAASQKRAGYVGSFKPDGTGNINSGSLDINRNGTASSSTNVSGTYNITANGSGTLSLTTDVGTFNFGIYVVNGTNNVNNPLTLYMVSTDDPQSASAEVGTLVFQDPGIAGSNADLNAATVIDLTGVSGTNTLVSLTNAGGDGAGHFNGTYDANNAGTIVAAKQITNYAYACATGGRCTVDLLGDPAANPVVPPVHFVEYLTTANRGFLLDQSSAAVLTGTMTPQKGIGVFAGTELAGAFAAATVDSGTSGVTQVEANLVMESPGNDVLNVAGVQDATDGGQHSAQGLAGTFTLLAPGTGTMTLTAPAAAKYVLYAVDLSNGAGGTVQHFYLLNVDAANPDASIVFAER